MPQRSRKETISYRKHIKKLNPKKGCEFCQFTKDSDQYVDDTEYFWVVKNIFPYSFWDEQKVSDHLMIVPKMHTDSLSELPKEAATDFVDLMSGYEKNGYSVYARSPGNKIKSVVHQHTHLIKTEDKRRSFLLFIRKPYIRIAR